MAKVRWPLPHSFAAVFPAESSACKNTGECLQNKVEGITLDGSVERPPKRSKIHPKGSGLPSARCRPIFPFAATLIEMSTTMG